MGLRDELIRISDKEAFQAIGGQLEADQHEYPSGMTDEEARDWYMQRLKEYPALSQLFQMVTVVALNPEHSEDITAGMITGAGIALLGIKAAANRQVFDGLETPPDLEP